MCLLRFELKDIKDGCLEQDLSCSLQQLPVLAELAGQEDVRFEQPLDFRLRIQVSGQIVEVDGNFRSEVVLKCGRCLQAFQQEVSSEFSLTFTPHVADESDTVEEEVELESDELGLIFYHDELIDLLEPLQDQVIMSLPISPVCNDACLGLCMECGGNLNSEKCDCTKKLFNNKFATLASLRVDSNDTD